MSHFSTMNDDLIRTHSQGVEQDFRRDALWGWIRRQLRPGRAIDVGGGSGYMTRRLLAAGYDTVLAEPDAELYDFSKGSLPDGATLQVIRQPAEQLNPAELGQFANILCLDVLEHIEDDSAALASIVRLLLPDGALIIAVPAMPSLYGKRDAAYGHFRRHSKASLTRLIEGAGLRVETMRFWNLLGVPVYFFFEKVLRRPIDDRLRRVKGGIVSRAIRHVLYRWLLAETRLPLLAGLSLLAVARRVQS